jgi:hypothetical protein
LLLLAKLENLQPRVPVGCAVLEDLLWFRGPPVQESVQIEPVGEDDAEREAEVLLAHVYAAMPQF